MNLTFDEAIENHRKMWNWIADETEKRQQIVDKADYFIENNIDEYVLHKCFCCQYTMDSIMYGQNCEICPIGWKDKYNYCACENQGTSYQKWTDTLPNEWQSAAKYAREIANLPAREGVGK